MSGRIRIDLADVANAPEPSEIPTQAGGNSNPAASGEVFGRDCDVQLRYR